MTTRKSPAKLCIKRAYSPAAPTDGYRILVDRLWPRGLSKEKAALDDWMKEVTPSTALRTWFGHDPGKWKEFSEKYKAELDEHKDAVDKLLKVIHQQEKVTLVYAAADEQHTHALVLQQYIQKHLRS